MSIFGKYLLLINFAPHPPNTPCIEKYAQIYSVIAQALFIIMYVLVLYI